jgi:hypothetical protein
MDQPGPSPDTPTGWRFLLPGSIKLALAWVFIAITLTACTLFSLATLRVRAEAYLHHIAHF